MTRYGPIIILVVLALTTGGFILWSHEDERGKTLPLSTTPLPEVTLIDFEGRRISLEDSGMPIVVNSWATWCPFCREELRDFSAIQEEFAGKVLVVAIDRAEPLPTVKRYTDELGVTGKILLLLDPADAFYRAIDGFSMPETIFVDREGIIRMHKRGPMMRSEIRERVVELLNVSS